VKLDGVPPGVSARSILLVSINLRMSRSGAGFLYFGSFGRRDERKNEEVDDTSLHCRNEFELDHLQLRAMWRLASEKRYSNYVEAGAASQYSRFPGDAEVVKRPTIRG